MSRKRSSDSEEAKEAMQYVTWDHVLAKTSLDRSTGVELLFRASVMNKDENGLILQGLLDCLHKEENSENWRIVYSTIMSLFSDIHVSESAIIRALKQIHKEGIRYKRRHTEDASASALGDLSLRQNSCRFPPRYVEMHALHVSLRVKAFGTFLDAMNRPGPIESKFVNFAGNLVLACSRVHPDEDSLIEAVQPIIKRLVSGMDVSVGKMSSDSEDDDDDRRPATSDTTVMMQNKDGQQIALVHWQFKRDIAKVTSNPDIQNIAHFLRFQKKWQGQSAPLLMVSLAGFSHMQVFGAACNGGDYCIDPLSLPLSTLFVPDDPLETTQKVAVLLRAIHGAVVDLKQHYECDVHSNRHPYYMHENGLSHVWNLLDKENVFEGKHNDQQVVVKFTRTYGLEAHQLLAEHQLAPKIISHETLPGGWIVVMYEYVEGTDYIRPNPISEVTKGLLKNAVDILHTAGFVHGDLRPPNILITKEGGVCILDFDWAGKCGEVYYPSKLNFVDCDWHRNVELSGPIEYEHDLYQIQNLIK